MFRRISQLLILSFLATALFANTQKSYSYDSPEYMKTEALCLIAGVSGPSDFTPVTADELLLALRRIDKATLSDGLLSELHLLENALINPNALLEKDDFAFNSSIVASPELYLQSAKDASILSSDWQYQYRDRRAILDLPLEIWASSYIYGELVLSVKDHFVNENGSSFSKQMSHNIPMLNGNDLQKSMPATSSITIGGNTSHLFLGRDRQRLGGGKTGSLMLGDNFYYQNFGKFSIHLSPFTFNYSITYFDRQKNTLITDYDNFKSRRTATQLENFGFSGPQQIRVMQNYQISLSESFVISLNFGNLFDSDNSLDIRMLNPFMFMHNLFNFTTYNNNDYLDGAKIEANNHFSLALDCAIAPGWSIYLELMVDQFQLPSESSSTEKEPPNAIGAMLNIANAAYLLDGYLHSYFEAAYTSPNLYLNEKYANSAGDISHDRKDSYDSYYWNQDLILGNSIWWGNDISYSGYIHGPDTILLELGSCYESQSWSLGAKIRYKAHGERGIRLHENQYQHIHYTDSVWDMGLTGTVEHTLLLNLFGSYEFSERLSIYADLAHYECFNYDNVKGARLSNTQLALGLSCKIGK